MKGTKKIQRILSILTVLVLLFMTALPASAAVNYPSGVTKEQSYSAIDKADTVIYSLLKQVNNTTLREMVLPELYSGTVLSQLTKEIYSAVEENAGSLSALGINTSVQAVANALTPYGNVADWLYSFGSWAEVDLSAADWGIDSKEGFASAVSAILSPFNELLYALLCGGSYSINPLIGIKGSNGYDMAIVPTLVAFGCQSITPSDQFYSDAYNDKSTMLYHIAFDLITFAEGILDAPFGRLTEVLPSIANYIINGGLDSAVSVLVAPLKLQVLNISTIFNVDSALSFISDSESYTQNFALNFNEIIAGSGINMAPIDFNEIAACGYMVENAVVPDKADVFIILLRFLFDTLRLNKDSLGEMMGSGEVDMTQIISSVTNKDTDELVTLFIGLLTQSYSKYNDYKWTFAEFSPSSVTYTANLGADSFRKVVDGMDKLLDDFIAESGEAASISELLRKEIYSSKTLTSIVSGIYGMFEAEDMSAVGGILGLKLSPSALADELAGDGQNTAANNLSKYSKWSKIDPETFSWGFKAGNKNAFVNALCSALSPFNELFGMMFAEDKFQVFGAIDIYGTNGYNTAIIPVLEALGCESSTIMSYEEYKAAYARDNGIKAIFDPIFALVDRIIESPVKTVTKILPNLLYFMSDGLGKCIDNLLYPFDDLINTLGMREMIDVSLMRDVNLLQLLSELVENAELDIKLPKIDFIKLSGLGNVVSVQSKRTFGGQPVNVSYVNADQPAVMLTLLRYIAETLKMPGNEDIITSLLSSGMGDMGDAAQLLESFAGGLGEEISGMTVDETVEWIHKIFFRERVTVNTEEQEEYLPTIIYKEKRNIGGAVFTVFLILLAVGGVFAYKYRREIEELLEEMKIRIAEKKADNN